MEEFKKASSIIRKLNDEDIINLLKTNKEWNYQVPFSYFNNYILSISYKTNNTNKIPSYENMACSFDKNMLFEYGKDIAKLALKNNRNVLLEPNLYLKREYIKESFSEDPIHTALLASSLINGANEIGVSMIPRYEFNLKEYIMSFNIDKKNLYETYLKPIKLLNELSPLDAFKIPEFRINRKYINEDRELLDELLNVTKFNGITLSDKYEIINESNHFNNISLSLDNASRTNLVNKEIITKQFSKNASYLLKYGDINKFKNVEDVNYEKYIYNSANSTVLLKNDDLILPLDRKNKLLILGSLENDPNLSYLTESLKTLNVNFVYRKGYEYNLITNNRLLINSINDADKFDKVIIFIRNQNNKKEEVCKAIEDLIEQTYLLNKNIIIVFEVSHPLTFTFKDLVKGIILSYKNPVFNKSIFYTLYGLVSPSGRLIESWKRKNDIESSIKTNKTNNYLTNSIFSGYKYFEKYNIEPLFKFGDGFGYSSFKFQKCKYSIKNNNILINLTITNTGDFDEEAPVIVYLNKENESNLKENKYLIDFNKTLIKKKETKVISFKIPFTSIETYDFDTNKLVIEKTKYNFIFSLNDNNDFYLPFNIPSRYAKDLTTEDYLNDFYSNFEFEKEEEEKDSINSLLEDLGIEHRLFKKETLFKIDKLKEEKPKKHEEIALYTRNYPIRVFSLKYKLYTKEELENIFSEDNK